MIVFGDSSGFFALLVHDDFMHVRAKLNFDHFAAHDMQLVTSSYVLLETLSLLRRRVGMEAVWDQPQAHASAGCSLGGRDLASESPAAAARRAQ